MSTNPHAVQFDPELIARYDVQAPRYTSYPTAPQFHGQFGPADYRAMAAQSNHMQPPSPLSLYVHVPFCWSPCFYCGCNRIITHDKGRSNDYLDALEREMELLAPLFDRNRPVRQLHLGGGTPNFMSTEQLGSMLEAMRARFPFPDDAEGVEASIEVDPRFADHDYVLRLAEIGFNRVSIGLQDFDPEVQKAVNRIQSVEETEAVIQGARASGFHSVNIDLIYGLPKQTLGGFSGTLDEVIRLAPDRLAVYGYAHLPHVFKAQNQLDASDLPDPATRLALFGLALDKLQNAGYIYIGMDHFARPDDELVQAQRNGTLQRNFQGYSTRAECDIVGLGMSAIGRIGNSYTQNPRDLVGYYLALDNQELPVTRGIALKRDDLIRRELIGELMCHGRLDMARFGARHQLRFEDYFGAELDRLRPLQADGLLQREESILQVSARGRLLLRNIAMQFDAYLVHDQAAPQTRYSRSI